jgi:hypothetical protein
VVGNLECRIKFYREKKPRQFFYTIEYPYPPTNSAARKITCEYEIRVTIEGGWFTYMVMYPSGN